MHAVGKLHTCTFGSTIPYDVSVFREQEDIVRKRGRHALPAKFDSFLTYNAAFFGEE